MNIKRSTVNTIKGVTTIAVQAGIGIVASNLAIAVTPKNAGKITKFLSGMGGLGVAMLADNHMQKETSDWIDTFIEVLPVTIIENTETEEPAVITEIKKEEDEA